MADLVLHPTALSQWYALVSEAAVRCHTRIHEDSESYLVFLLMRFNHELSLAESVLALDFLNAMHEPNYQKRKDILRNVGDKSLLFCGLFPGIADRKSINLSYFMNMGQSAYFSIATLEDTQTSDLFALLGTQFVPMKNVLQSMCELQTPVLPMNVSRSAPIAYSRHLQ